MAVTKDKPAPYAPGSAIIELIERHRNRGLPSPVTAEVLARSGISDSLIPRTLYALQALDLINEEGKPTEVFERIRLAPEPDYKVRLKEWLDAAYADVISFVDPAIDDEIKIRDAFRSYNPVGQQSRMVTLFMSLYAAAGSAAEKTPKTRQPKPQRVVRTLVSSAVKQPAAVNQKPQPTDVEAMPPVLAGLLKSLPLDGKGWTAPQRDKFLNAFGAVLDFCFPVVEQLPSEKIEGGEE